MEPDLLAPQMELASGVHGAVAVLCSWLDGAEACDGCGGVAGARLYGGPDLGPGGPDLGAGGLRPGPACAEELRHGGGSSVVPVAAVVEVLALVWSEVHGYHAGCGGFRPIRAVSICQCRCCRGRGSGLLFVLGWVPPRGSLGASRLGRELGLRRGSGICGRPSPQALSKSASSPLDLAR